MLNDGLTTSTSTSSSLIKAPFALCLVMRVPAILVAKSHGASHTLVVSPIPTNCAQESRWLDRRGCDCSEVRGHVGWKVCDALGVHSLSMFP